MPTKLITINIRRYLVTQPRSRRQKRLSSYVKDRIAHYMKVTQENVKIDSEMNKALVKFYSKNMLPLKANVNIDNGTAKVSLYSEKKPVEAQKSDSKTAQKDQKPKTEAKKEQSKEPSKKNVKEQKKESSTPAEQKPGK
jgi:ribosomal protein L31E